MQAALLPDRGVVKIAGEAARTFLNGLLTADIGKVTPQAPAFAALLTPQGKIIVDCIVAEAAEADGGGFFLDCPRALVRTLIERLTFYKLRAKVTIEDRSEVLAVMAVWGGRADSEYGLVYPDPRLPELGFRVMLPPDVAAEAAREMGAALTEAAAYETHRIALGVPRGGPDFIFGDTFPHDADMDQLGGVDFHKGCYVGQEVVARVEHRGTARTRIVPVAFDGAAPDAGVPVMAGDKAVGTMGSAAAGHGLAQIRLDRIEPPAAGLSAGGVPLRLRRLDWIRFALPDTKGGGA
ncbi:MAG: folate-binding protein [Pseudorhodoplanes sp.]|nr:folate-binding protein [Pseudorhodoplanes sp.]